MKLLVLYDHASLMLSARERALFLQADFSESVTDLGNWKALNKQFQSSPYHALFLIQIGKGCSLLSLNQQIPMKPLYIDFSSNEWRRRLFNISSKSELAAKALGLGLNKERQHWVFDANAGTGQDLFVFSALGAQVLACERSALVFCLLRDALDRAAKVDELQSIVARIELVFGDAKGFLDGNEESQLHKLTEITSIYLDPMFPEKKHQAAAKKQMQIFQTLIGNDEDASELLSEALKFKSEENNCTRVVLKRPKLAEKSEEALISRQLIGNSTRFDIYF